MYDPNEAREFIRILTGSSDTPVHFQCYFDPDKKLGLSPGPNGHADEWCDTFDNSLDYIENKQDADCGVYVCINETDGVGREENNITSLRCVMVDFDGVAEPDWSITPHLINMRDDTHGHAFWLIENEGVEFDEWSIMQRRLAMFYDTDRQVVDPSRVIRLPGSKHLKNPDKPAEYRIVENNEDLPKYSFSELREAHVLSANLDAELLQWAEAREGILDGTGFEYVESEARRFIRFASVAAYPAKEGQGTHELYRVALYGRDHGLPYEDVLNLLWEYYNPRCEPPWEEEEFDHFESVVFRAYKYAVSAPGCKTFKASLKTLSPLKEPASGWEGQYERFHDKEVNFKPDEVEHVTKVKYENNDVDRGHRISAEDADILGCQLTGKSSHYSFAKIFDGLVYDGINLIRYEGQFFRYSGTHWEIIHKDVVKAQIQRAFSAFEPSDSMCNGIYKVYESFVNREYAENGTWLSEPNRDASDLVVFNNCIVDFSNDEIMIHEHTPDFFNLNSLPHDYNPDAECELWVKTLNEIWDGDQELIKQLQMWFGYCLVSDVSLEKFAMLKGKSRSGKGTVTTVLTSLIGDENVCGPALDNIYQNSTLEEMAKSSLCLIPEAHDVHASVRDRVVSQLKSITGGDKISYHKMYAGSQNAVFKTKLMISTNNIPHFVDPSGALVNRMLVFPFWNSFVGREDFTLKTRLLEEIEGITQWAIEGLRMLRANDGKFVESKIGAKEKKEIREDMNPLSQFFSKMCDFNSEEESTVDELYSAYRLWAMTIGVNKPVTMLRFRQMVRDSAIPVQFYERGNERGFKGVVLKHDIDVGNVVRGTFGKVRK